VAQPRPILGRLALVALAVALLVVALENAVISAFFRPLERVTTDFSAAYLSRELDALAKRRDETIFLGDSVLWGYRLQSGDTAVARLSADGCACINLAFKGGNPPNYFALVELLAAHDVRPRAVVLEVNQRVFNPADGEYKTLHPAVASLAAGLLARGDRALLEIPRVPASPAVWLDASAARVSLLYALRTDIRETVFPEDDPAPGRITADLFLGTYDLTPLREDNVAVHFLDQTVIRLRRAGIPVVAFLTPTNHRLLHAYIDGADYRRNGAFLRMLLERRGARVLDLDSAVPAGEFFDNDHLTIAGQRRLETLLAPALPQ
jgi:hypothetical protein